MREGASGKGRMREGKRKRVKVGRTWKFIYPSHPFSQLESWPEGRLSLPETSLVSHIVS